MGAVLRSRTTRRRDEVTSQRSLARLFQPHPHPPPRLAALRASNDCPPVELHQLPLLRVSMQRRGFIRQFHRTCSMPTFSSSKINFRFQNRGPSPALSTRTAFELTTMRTMRTIISTRSTAQATLTVFKVLQNGCRAGQNSPLGKYTNISTLALKRLREAEAQTLHKISQGDKDHLYRSPLWRSGQDPSR